MSKLEDMTREWDALTKEVESWALQSDGTHKLLHEGAMYVLDRLPLDVDWRRKYEQLQSDLFCACLETCGAGSYSKLYARIMELANKNELEGML